MIPGLDFMQNMMKTAGAGLPGVGQWIAPTLNPEELEKRIEELRTVQFWLEQNARMISATIQTLEVQRLTLSTLKTMNVPLEEMREAMKLRVPAPDAAAPTLPPATPEAPAEPPAAAAVDPMKWWGALTQQFADIASQAMKEPAAPATPRRSPAPATKAAKKRPAVKRRKAG